MLNVSVLNVLVGFMHCFNCARDVTVTREKSLYKLDQR